MFESNIVTKANELITAHYNLSTEEQKIILTLSSMVQLKDIDFCPYEFKIKDFLMLLGVTDKSRYTKIPKITKTLMKKVFEIKNGKTTLQISWLSSVEYTEGSGKVILCFDPKLKPYMLKLQSMFTTYKLSNILNLKSKYSIRMYEILKANQFKTSVILELDKLKNMLGINQIEYPRFYDFKLRVLEQSKNELSKHTDLTFNFNEIKNGRKIVSIKFYIFSNSQETTTTNFDNQINIEESLNSTSDILDIVKNTLGVDFKKSALKKLIDTKGVESVNYYLQNWCKFNCKKNNRAGFFYSAVLNDWEIPQQDSYKPDQATNYQQRDISNENFDAYYYKFDD